MTSCFMFYKEFGKTLCRGSFDPSLNLKRVTAQSEIYRNSSFFFLYISISSYVGAFSS